MNTERLYAIAKKVSEDMATSNAASLVSQLSKTIRQQMASPAAETVSQIESKLAEVLAIKDGNWFRYPETWNNTLEALGATSLKDASFVDQVTAAVRGNSITLESAAEAVAAVFSKLQQLQQGLANVISGFESLGLTTREPEERDAELSILMPRAAFHNELRAFSKDVLDIAKFLELAEEIATGSRQPVVLEELSTTDPVIIAGVSVSACLLVLKLIQEILTTIKSTYELREARAKAIAAEASAKSVGSIEADIQEKITAGLTAAVESLANQVRTLHGPRGAELRTELDMAVPRMAARIDNGYRIEGHVRADAGATADEAKRNEIAQVEQLSSDISYRKLPPTPVLQLSLALDDESETTRKPRKAS